MTSTISPLAHVLRLLKVELAQASEARLGARAGAKQSHAAPAGPNPSAATALQGLRTKLRAARTQGGSVPPAKALRLFVEAALLDELGSGLQLDSALNGLVERTCLAIEQDAGSAALLADALKDLQALAD